LVCSSARGTFSVTRGLEPFIFYPEKVEEQAMVEVTQDYAVFNARDYLEEYYTAIPSENEALIKFLVGAFSEVPKGVRVLEFGSGPTLFTALAAARRAREIHLSDFHYANRLELQMWLENDGASFDWSSYTRLVLQLEGQDISTTSVAQRELVTRGLVRRVMHCDATRHPSLEETHDSYDVVVSNLCLEAVAQDVGQWQAYLQNATTGLRPDGKLILTAVKGSQTYSVGREVFRVLPLFESDLKRAVERAGFHSLVLETTHASHPVHAYDGLMFVTATKS
jgi:SAM-dependent methyltransferase